MTEVLHPGVVKELRKAWREASHPIPEFDIPEGWERNEPMCDEARTEIGLRNEAYDTFLEIHSTHATSGVEGPYYMEVREQVGGEDSFETRARCRAVGVEPGAVQEYVDGLTGWADAR